MSLFLEPAIAAAGAALAGVAVSLVKHYIASSRQGKESVTYSLKDGRNIEILSGSDLESVSSRVAALGEVSPRLAVLEGWNLVTKAILDRAFAAKNKEFDPSDDILEVLNSLSDISVDTLARVKMLRAARNMIAHSRDQFDETALLAAVKGIVPILSDLKNQKMLQEK